MDNPFSLRAYCATRRHLSGGNACAALLDVANAGPLAPEEYHHPSMEHLHLHFNNIASWGNDLHGIHTEAHEPDQNRNMVLLFAAQGHSLQEGIDYTARRVRDEIAAFQEEATRLERDASKELRGYISGMREWLMGDQDWADLVTHRYLAKFAEQDADDRGIQLASRGITTGAAPS
ncbi:hypothetical protein [Myxococcus sp. AM011]|uniref:terpene synthase family protein n=1 Tax=Myxococcus sp. AM011 TaxID=2745200 RepID=UPI0020CC17ED|nr:hypothetical protein [Myxococcus sp. AM011]